MSGGVFPPNFKNRSGLKTNLHFLYPCSTIDEGGSSLASLPLPWPCFVLQPPRTMDEGEAAFQPICPKHDLALMLNSITTNINIHGAIEMVLQVKVLVSQA